MRKVQARLRAYALHVRICFLVNAFSFSLVDCRRDLQGNLMVDVSDAISANGTLLQTISANGTLFQSLLQNFESEFEAPLQAEPHHHDYELGQDQAVVEGLVQIPPPTGHRRIIAVDDPEMKEKMKRQCSAISFLIVYFLLFIISVIYLVNSSDPQVKAYSFKVISLIMAIFCALLIEKTQHGVIMHGLLELFRGGEHHEGAEEHSHSLLESEGAEHLHHGHSEFDILWFVPVGFLWYCSLTFFSKSLAHSHIRVYVWVEGIVTHLVAFTMIAVIAELQSAFGTALFNNGHTGFIAIHYCSWVPVSVGVFYAWHRLMKFIRIKFLGSDEGIHDEIGHERLKELLTGRPSALLTDPLAGDAGEAPPKEEGTETSKAADINKPAEVDPKTEPTSGAAAPPAEDKKDDEALSETDSSLADTEEKHHHEPWYEIAAECEFEVSAIVFGWAFATAVAALKNPFETVQTDCDLTEHGCEVDSDVQILVVLGVTIIVCIFILFVSKKRDSSQDSNRLSDAIHCVQTHLTFAFAFLSMVQTRMFVASLKVRALYYLEDIPLETAIFKSPIWSKSMCFMLYWPVFGIVTIVADWLADHSHLSEKCAHKIIKGMSLATAVFLEIIYGQALESTTDASMDVLAKWLTERGVPQSEKIVAAYTIVVETVSVMCLLALVLPAWALYLAPPAMGKVPKRHSTRITRITKRASELS